MTPGPWSNPAIGLFWLGLGAFVGSVAVPAAAQTSDSCGPVEVRELRLYVCEFGKGDDVTVLFDSGARSDSRAWSGLAEEVGNWAHVITYDRAGLGRSGPGPAPRTVSAMARDIRVLLDQLAPDRRIVLVGHSAGGWRVRRFAELYPDRVSGLLLLDSPHEDFEAYRMSTLTPAEREERVRSLESSRLDTPRGVQLEYEGMSEVGMELSGVLPDVPLVVVSAGRHSWVPERLGPAHEAEWRRLQEALAGSTPRGRYLLVEEVGHQIQREAPDVVVELVRALVQEVDDRGPSPQAPKSPVR